MNYTKFTPEQKMLNEYIVRKVEDSGCNTHDIIEVFAEVCGSLLAYVAPSREELTEYLDKNLIPEMRRVTMTWYDLKQVREQFGNI